MILVSTLASPALSIAPSNAVSSDSGPGFSLALADAGAAFAAPATVPAAATPTAATPADIPDDIPADIIGDLPAYIAARSSDPAAPASESQPALPGTTTPTSRQPLAAGGNDLPPIADARTDPRPAWIAREGSAAPLPAKGEAPIAPLPVPPRIAADAPPAGTPLPAPPVKTLPVTTLPDDGRPQDQRLPTDTAPATREAAPSRKPVQPDLSADRDDQPNEAPGNERKITADRPALDSPPVNVVAADPILIDPVRVDPVTVGVLTLAPATVSPAPADPGQDRVIRSPDPVARPGLAAPAPAAPIAQPALLADRTAVATTPAAPLPAAAAPPVGTPAVPTLASPAPVPSGPIKAASAPAGAVAVSPTATPGAPATPVTPTRIEVTAAPPARFSAVPAAPTPSIPPQSRDAATAAITPPAATTPAERVSVATAPATTIASDSHDPLIAVAAAAAAALPLIATPHADAPQLLAGNIVASVPPPITEPSIAAPVATAPVVAAPVVAAAPPVAARARSTATATATATSPAGTAVSNPRAAPDNSVIEAIVIPLPTIQPAPATTPPTKAPGEPISIAPASPPPGEPRADPSSRTDVRTAPALIVPASVAVTPTTGRIASATLAAPAPESAPAALIEPQPVTTGNARINASVKPAIADGPDTATLRIAAPADVPPSPAAPLIGVAQPAARAFAAAITAAARPIRLDRDRHQADGQPLISLDARPDIDAAAIKPVSAADNTPLDTRREDWTRQLIDRIDALRDAADAGDTRIRLVPAGLGKIDVALRQQGDVLHVHFAAEVPATRALLAEAQPRLAELASERGLRLGQTGVDGGAQGQDQRRAPNGQSAFQPPAPPGVLASRSEDDVNSDQRIA